MRSDEILGGGWKWSRRVGSKVRKRGGAQLVVQQDEIKYVTGRRSGPHGEWFISYNTHPVLTMVALTHLESELNRYIRDEHDLR